MKRLLLLFILLIFASGLCFSADFGALLDQKLELDHQLFSYSPSLTPWFSWNGSNGFSVYLSGVFWLEYNNYYKGGAADSGLTNPAVKTEISRFAMSYRGNKIFLEAGRVGYSDTLGFTSSGLYDGVRFETTIKRSSISAGAFYTGLLYSETAKIMMTEDDGQRYDDEWKWGSFDGYFAPRRLLTALRWDYALGEINDLSAEILAQFDLSGSSPALHSQYGEIKFNFYPRYNLGVSTGLLLETMEYGGSFSAAFGLLGRAWLDLPGSLNHRLSTTLKFTSGNWNDAFTAFTPINSVTQGIIFQETNSGLASLSVDYNIRILRTLTADAAIRYFMRTYDDSADPGIPYGGEIWASLAWQPLDDIRVNFGTGAFFPQLGNIYPNDTGVMWKISAGVTVSF